MLTPDASDYSEFRMYYEDKHKISKFLISKFIFDNL